MTPHPLATWVQLTVSPQRRATRDRRRRRAARLVLSRRRQPPSQPPSQPTSQPTSRPARPAVARIPEQRRPAVLPPSTTEWPLTDH
jgi:hypothetical protein